MAFGGAFSAIKAGLTDTPPLLFAALRYDLAALLLLGYGAFVLHGWRPHRLADWLAVLAEGVPFFGSSGLLYLGQQYTTAGVISHPTVLVPVCSAEYIPLYLARYDRQRLGGFSDHAA